METTSPRFALLEHDGRGATDAATRASGLHWDLLIELDGGARVATWRLADNPCVTDGPIGAERIAAHRRLYFAFEGEVGGGRGTVRRLDCGSVAVLAVRPTRVEVVFGGTILRGGWCLSQAAAGWELARTDAGA